MSKKPEGLLHKRLKENLPNSHITRIESRVNLGTPDCLVALTGEGVFVMVELKVVRKGRKIAMSPHQVAFHLKHADLNCPTYFLVEYHPPGTTSVLKGFLYLYDGSQAEDLFMRGIDVEPIDKWPLSHVMWNVLRARLLE
jgi:hypothetical protein